VDGTGLNSGESSDSSKVANQCEQMKDLRLKEYFEFISKCCFFTEFVLDKVNVRETELAVPRLIGLVLRLDPTGLYQKSYPGSEGVTEGILITRNKSG
jgi:hypothetical protein